MATDTPSHHPNHALHSNEHPELHEHSDVSIKGLVVTIVLFVVVGLVTHVMLYYLFWFMESQQAKKDTPRSSLRGASAAINTPEPRVQGIPGYHRATPADDTVDMMRDVHEVLSSYGPTEDPNFVRIPIDRAMELSLQGNAFKARAATTQQGATTAPKAPAAGAASHATH